MYNNLLFFYIFLIILVPIALMGLNGIFLKRWGIILNVLLLWIFLDIRMMIKLILYLLFQSFMVWFYFNFKQKIEARLGKKPALILMLFITVLPLVLTKTGEIRLNPLVHIIGISYISFRIIGVVLEIHDGIIKEFSPIDFIYFVSFFPTITSGPIDRYRRFTKDITLQYSKEDYTTMLKRGIFLLLTGVLFKFVFAQLISYYWMKGLIIDSIPLKTLSYMYSYSFFLYFDFCGYSLMAMGIGYILGIKVPQNFNRPFLSTDIKDFWNRWHMSLSFWFRDYIYNRFVLKGMKKKWFKNKYTLSYLGYILTMGTMGVWHGLRPNFILYGIYHGGLICATDFIFRKYKLTPLIKKDLRVKYLSIFITFNLICFGFLIFSGYLIK